MNDLERKVAEARRRYLSSLPGKARAIEAAVDGEDRATLCMLAHRLAGSAGLHDLEAIQARAAALDMLCDQGAPTRELRAAAALLIETLDEASDALD